MKDKKGFTLIELIAVIVILGIVISLASLSIVSISKNVKEKNYDSLKKRIEVAAEKLFSETGLTEFTVQTLIDDGYIEPDDNENIYDPRNSKIMLNCHMITVDENGEALYDESDETANCEFDSSVYTALEMYYQNTETEEKTKISIANPPWFNYYGKLIVQSTKDNVLSNSISYSWKSKLNPGVIISTDKSLKINNEINDYVEANVYDNSSGKNYIASSVIKVDTTAPVVSNIEISNKESWKAEKNISFDINDNLSGVKDYIITNAEFEKEDLETKNWTEYSKETTVTINEVGTYYIYARDNAGNISGATAFEIENVDSTSPTCKYYYKDSSGNVINESTTWTNQNKTVYFGCEDNENGSGCVTKIYDSDKNEITNYKEFTSTTKTYTLDYYIYDNAGNSTYCNDTINIYVDKTKPDKPTITNSSNGASTNVSTPVTITAKSKDDDSQIDKICYSEGNTGTCEETWSSSSLKGDTLTVSKTWTSYKYNHDWYGYCNATVYIWACDKAGNCSDKVTTGVYMNIFNYYAVACTSNILNCRTGQGTSYSVYTTFSHGTNIRIKKVSSDWYKAIDYGCYVSSTWLSADYWRC